MSKTARFNVIPLLLTFLLLNEGLTSTQFHPQLPMSAHHQPFQWPGYYQDFGMTSRARNPPIKTASTQTGLNIPNDKVVVLGKPTGRVYFAQLFSLIASAGGIGATTTTSTSTSTVSITCTKSTTACSGRRRRAVLAELLDDQFQHDARQSRMMNDALDEKRITHQGVGSTGAGVVGIAPSKIQRMQITLSPSWDKDEKPDDVQNVSTVPELRGSIVDKLVPVVMKNLLTSSDGSFGLDGLLSKLTHETDVYLGPTAKQGRSTVTVISLLLTTTTTTSTPSCSTSSGFNQCS